MGALPINKNFFSSWNSNMSYVLGFIVADGCIGIRRIRKRDGVKNYYFNITSKDKIHLEHIKKIMGSYHKIHSKKNGSGNKKDYYFIQVGCQEICKDLLKNGIYPRKTYNLDPIKVPNKYFSDFVRGFFDGDGSVYIYKVNGTSQIKASFVSHSLNFFEKFNDQLCKNLDISKKAIHQKLPQREDQKLTGYSSCFYIDDCKRLAEFMYGNDPVLYLPRKRRIFERWKLINRRHYIKKNYPSKIGWHLNNKLPTRRGT